MQYKYFVCQSIKGKTLDEIKKEREVVIKSIKESGDIYLHSIFDYEYENEKEAAKMIGKCIEILADADIVIFMRNWERSRVCKIEHLVAVEYNKNIVYL